jgi:deoxyribodipyrimidine photolyase-related protein
VHGDGDASTTWHDHRVRATFAEMTRAQPTVWVLGDQLNRHIGALASATPQTHRVLMVESAAKLSSKRWHVQRAHFVVTSMRRLADELRAEGFHVDYRSSPSLPDGLAAHRAEFAPPDVVAMEPASRAGWRMLERAGVRLERTDQFLCHPDEFAAWAGDRTSLRMEDFYRWQRRRLGYLMDGDQPATGRWNYDSENRQPPPKGGLSLWPDPLTTPQDEVDAAVLADLPEHLWGALPTGLWATSRSEALRRLDHFVAEVLPHFGPHEDAMLSSNWHLAHAMISHALNVSLLHPAEVCDAVEEAYRAGRVPIASAEGFIRQVIGWREYVWGVYWLWGHDYGQSNALGATRPMPPVLTGAAPTRMRCVDITMANLHDHGWLHHIQRLMILGNLGLIAGIDPQAMTDWMWATFVDGAEWVMAPNVVGMALHADGGRMATKPYAAGGAYIDRMSDYCGDCVFDRTRRVGDRACPFTTLYWDFLARHDARLAGNHRLRNQVNAARRLGDMPAVRERATQVLALLDAGEL